MRKIDWRWLWLALFAVAACDQGIKGAHVDNKPPIVWLAAGPPEGSVGTYSVELFWGGWDPDGEISHYEYLISDNVTGVYDPDARHGDWTPVVANDSTFVFSADSLVDPSHLLGQQALFQRSHTFFIRAVDETNLRSTPVHRSFTSQTISPTVEVKIPSNELGLTPADMPPISTFEWDAEDIIDSEDNKQPPDSVQWALINTAPYGDYSEALKYLRKPESIKDWHPWTWYRAPLDSGKSWTTPPLDFGTYVFAIRAKDEAGAVTPVLEEPVNARRIKIAPRISGPTLQVQNEFVGKILASSCDFPVTIADIAANVFTSFSMSACARHYGGTVAGYRYGWDIADLDDPNQWEIDYTPFVGQFATTPPRKFNFGTHTFTCEVIDNSGFCSRIEVKLNIVRFTGERNLILVDDYKVDESPGAGWASSGGGLPNDAEHDGFWLDMLSNLDGFDPGVDMLATSIDREIPLTTLAGYKNILWSVFGVVNISELSDLPLLYTFIRYRSKRVVFSDNEGACAESPQGGGRVLPNAIALAMQAGVHVMIAGHQPVQNILPRQRGATVPPFRFPLILLYELEPGANQIGNEPPNQLDRPGDHGFGYRELCLEVLDLAWLTIQRARSVGTGSNRRYCPVNGWRTFDNSLETRRDMTMRAAEPLDPAFDRLELRSEVAGNGRAYHASKQGIDAEVYNPRYFRVGAACQFVPASVRPCFQPIYGLVCLAAGEPTYGEPVAFWTSAHADVIAEDIVGAVPARSVAFGFPPVYFEPSQVKPGIEHILFDEWQLPRRPVVGAR